MKNVFLPTFLLLWLLPAPPALFPQSADLADAEAGEEITTMQSGGIELRLKSSPGVENTQATDPAGLVLNPYPYGYHDVQPPSAPQGLQGAALSDTRILLTFGAAGDNVRVLGYEVYRDGRLIGSTDTEAFTDTGLVPMASYRYQVAARDRSGNASPLSSTALATTLDTTTANMPAQFLVQPYVRSVSDTQAVISFTANKTVDARIDYGPDLGYGSSLAAANSAEYVVGLTGLTPGRTYSYRVVLDPGGTALPSDGGTFTMLVTADGTPPSFLQQPFVSSVSSTTALVSWQTDEEAIGVLECGLLAPGEISVNEPDYGTSHSVAVSGLVPGMVYYFRVRITDRFSNGPTWSPDDAFVTTTSADTTPPLITVRPAVLYLSSDRALIGWTTNEPADSRIRFGTTSGLYDRTTADAAYTADHQVELLNLLENTVYYYVVRSQDTSGNLSAESAVRSFRTNRRADTTPPRLSRMTVTPAETQALVTWTTDTPATSLVAYGVSSGTYLYQKADPELLTSHELVLTGLDSNRVYYCQITSQDAAGNRAVSGEITFRTLPAGGVQDLVISGLTVTSTAARIDIRWVTTTAATTELQYRSADDAAWTFVEQGQLRTNHLVRLFPARLVPGTYYYRVAGTDLYGQRTEVSLDASGQPLQFVVQ